MAIISFTARDVLEWARNKPSNQRYQYSRTTNCAMAQFLRETGRADNPTVGSDRWDDWHHAPYSGYHKSGPHFIPDEIRWPLTSETFGELVEQLEAVV